MYTKLFSSLITSTVWLAPDETRIVWITMLALADKNGEVMASIPGLARLAGVSVDACRSAVEFLSAPDPDSRTKEEEGRRIREIEGGWWLINHGKYTRMASLDEMAEKNRERQARHRNRQKAGVTGSNAGVTGSNAGVTGSNAGVTGSNAPVTLSPDTHTHTHTHTHTQTQNTNTPPTPPRGREWVPTPDQLRVGGWFGRRATTAFSAKELTAWNKLRAAMPSNDWPEELDIMESYYTADAEVIQRVLGWKRGDDYRRRDLLTLLNNWPGELDRAGKFAKLKAAKDDNSF